MKKLLSYSIKAKLIAVFLLSGFPFGSLYGQYIEQVEEITAGNFFGYGARQMAMGGAGMMSLDGSALFYNPANLARIPRIEFNFGLSNQKYKDVSSIRALRREVDYSSAIPQASILSPRFDGFLSVPAKPENSKTNTRINMAILTVPYPTYRGSLVFGVGYARVANFDRIFRLMYIDTSATGDIVAVGDEFQSGSLNQWGAGFGIDLSPRISFGTALYLYTGKHEYNWEYNLDSVDYQYGEESLISDDYLGWNAKISLSIQLSRMVGLGLAVETPTFLSVDEEADYIYLGDPTLYYNFAEYNVKKPFVFSVGIQARLKSAVLALDLDYTDWSQLEYGDNDEMEIFNDDIRNYYTDVIRYRIGGEYIIPDWGLSLRAGYYNDPLPFKKRFINSDRDGISFGFGILVDQVLTIDVAYVHGSYSRNSDFIHASEVDSGDQLLGTYNLIVDEDISFNRIYLTSAYRF
jgi:hypothetical protein